MWGKWHKHLCPECRERWSHDDTDCSLEGDHPCDLCRAAQFYRDVRAKVNPSSSISFMRPPDIVSPNELRLMLRYGFRQAWELQSLPVGEWYEDTDVQLLRSDLEGESAEGICELMGEFRSRLRNSDLGVRHRGSLEQELYVCENALSTILSELDPTEKRAAQVAKALYLCEEIPELPPATIGTESPVESSRLDDLRASLEFVVGRKRLSESARFLQACRSRNRSRADYVDVNARGAEVELLTTGSSVPLLAEVVREGYGRMPYLVFHRIAKAVKTLAQESLRCSIRSGQAKVASLTFSHPEITVRLIGSRIADLPIDAPLPDILALLVKFRFEELEDSGLLARVLAAQEQTSKVIDKALLALGPLDIQREELSRFLWDQIRKRVEALG